MKFLKLEFFMGQKKMGKQEWKPKRLIEPVIEKYPFARAMKC
jgi:hypothetical protein